ncbi:MAG: hypothetical protein WCK55_06305 [Verrucomicrobiota bacterium]
MKRRPLHALLALAVASSFVACDKKPDASANPPAKPAEPAKPGEPAKPAEPAKTTATEPAAAPANVSAISAAYGFAAILPKDVEAFSANYRLHDLWVKLSTSNWSKTLLNMPGLKDDAKFQDMLAQWNSPMGMKGRDIFEAVLGNEFVIANPAGFGEKFMPWMDLFSEVQGVQMQQIFMTAMSGGRPPDSKKIFRDAAPELIPALLKCDIPPVLIASKAVSAKADIDGGMAMVLAKLGEQLPPGVEIGKFKVADKYDFQSITVNAEKLVAALQEEKIRAQVAEVMGDEAKAKAAVEALKKKRIEIAWGWVGDYLVISLGTDHSHVKFAAGDADSALAIAAVARRASQFADKKPLGISYAGAALLTKLSGKIEFADKFKKLSDELATLLKPEHIAAMQADVKKFEGKVQSLVATTFDPLVGIAYWDSGIRAEEFGGGRQTQFDTAKPLAFASLFTKTVFLFADGRSSSANDGKLASLIEDGAGILWGWYEKFGKTMVPPDEQEKATMAEKLAVPMVKDVWASSRKLAKALGNESAFVLDLNGTMPKLPNVPAEVADGKVPRIAWVAEMNDRTAVSAAWKGFETVIKQIAALAPVGAIPDPVMKKDGDLEIHYIQLPIPTDDLLPHIAISKDRWILSTSPSLSKEIAATPASAVGAPLGAEGRISLPALCDFADAWVKLAEKDPNGPFVYLFLNSSGDGPKIRANVGVGIRLVRAVQSVEWRVFNEGSETRNSVYLKLEDIK